MVLNRRFSEAIFRWPKPLTHGTYTIQEVAELVQGHQLTRQDFAYLILSRDRIIFDLYNREVLAPAGYALPLVNIVTQAWPELNYREKIESLLFLYRLTRKMEPLSQLQKAVEQCSEDLKTLISESNYFMQTDILYATNISALMIQKEFEPLMSGYLTQIKANIDSLGPYLNTFMISAFLKCVSRCIANNPEYATSEGPALLEQLSLKLIDHLSAATHKSKQEMSDLYEKLYIEISRRTCVGANFQKVKTLLKQSIKSHEEKTDFRKAIPSDFV